MIRSEEIAELSQTFVTREEHEDAFGYLVANMATKEDIRDLRAEMATGTGNLDIRLTNVEVNMATKQDLRNLEDRFDRKLDTRFDQVMVMMDKIAGTLDTMRLEMAASAVQYARQLSWNHKVAERLDISFD